MKTEENSAAPVPCRMFVILAREAPVALIFRRGPSKWVQLIKWNLEDDSFEPGAWFHGRLYEKRCDLSPDGTKVVYFAAKFNAKTLGDKHYTYAWTAVSKIPWLYALALWPKGDCWHGGGLFETNDRLWLNHQPQQAKPHRNHKPQGLKVIPNPAAEGEDEPIHFKRLQRDGWVERQEAQIRFEQSDFSRRMEEIIVESSGEEDDFDAFMERMSELDWEEGRETLQQDGFVTDVPGIFEKRHPQQDCILRMTYWWEKFTPHYEYALSPPASGGSDEGSEELQILTDATWAEWDTRGRLVYVQEGRLFAATVEGCGVTAAQGLADFNDQVPLPQPSPDWARRW